MYVQSVCTKLITKRIKTRMSHLKLVIFGDLKITQSFCECKLTLPPTLKVEASNGKWKLSAVRVSCTERETTARNGQEENRWRRKGVSQEAGIETYKRTEKKKGVKTTGRRREERNLSITIDIMSGVIILVFVSA